MNETLELLVRHGILILFAAVFIEQTGIPQPAEPWLLAAGALAGAGLRKCFPALGAAATSSWLADLVWRGRRAARTLHRLQILAAGKDEF
jgi:membrane protein DedA with SNARE-associated domain